jgi:hypothetical protein
MKKKLLGIGSLLFPAYVIAVLIVAALMSFCMEADARIPEAFLPAVVALLVFTFLSVAGLWFFITFDIAHIAMNPRLSGGAKAGWICAIWFLHVFSIPVYWFKHLRPPT